MSTTATCTTNCRFCSIKPGEELELIDIVEPGELPKLASAIGVSPSWAWRLFTRTGGSGAAPTPRIEIARKIADYFGVSMGCIYEVLARVKIQERRKHD